MKYQKALGDPATQSGGQKEFFEKHIKNLSNGYRIHFFEKDENIYIGYIGKHLKTKNDK